MEELVIEIYEDDFELLINGKEASFVRDVNGHNVMVKVIMPDINLNAIYKAVIDAVNKPTKGETK